MAEILTVFETGTGAKVEYIPLGKGDTAFPTRATITATAAATKNATSIAVDVVTATASQNIKLPAGTTLAFTDPVTGQQVVATLGAAVNVTTDAVAPYSASTTLTLIANHEAIPINSTSSNYIRLGARTTAEASIKLNDEGLFTFDSDLFKQSQIVSAEGEFKCSGAFSSVDAGLRTVQAQTLGLFDVDGTTQIATAGRYGWVVITSVAPTDNYASGTTVRGIALCNDLSIKIEAGKITTQDLPFKANGTIYIDQPQVA